MVMVSHGGGGGWHVWWVGEWVDGWVGGRVVNWLVGWVDEWVGGVQKSEKKAKKFKSKKKH
jgi:hypothetical protein